MEHIKISHTASTPLSSILMVVIVCIMFTIFYGWVHNIYLLTYMEDHTSLLFFLRIAGIFFAPLGVVLGFDSF